MDFIKIDQLPRPDFIQPKNFEEILRQLKQLVLDKARAKDNGLYEALSKIIDLESEPLNIENEVVAYLVMLERQRINEAALGTTAAFATDNDLDVIAFNEGLTRKVLQQADNSLMPPLPLIMESDDAVRERLYLAKDKKTTAGSIESYRAHALDAHALVKDVSVISPMPCYVDIYILSYEGNGTASVEVIHTVDKKLNDKTVRPVADRVNCRSVDVVEYNIEVFIDADDEPEIEPILAAVNKSLAAFAESNRKIGESIHIAAIISAAFVEGVKNVQVVSPAADIVLNTGQIGFCTGISVNKRG